jgi:hypothetical protein
MVAILLLFTRSLPLHVRILPRPGAGDGCRPWHATACARNKLSLYGAALKVRSHLSQAKSLRTFGSLGDAGDSEQVEALDNAVKLLAERVLRPARSPCWPCRILAPGTVDHELTETALQHLFLEPGQRADHVVGKLASENRAQGDGFSGGTRTIY